MSGLVRVVVVDGEGHKNNTDVPLSDTNTAEDPMTLAEAEAFRAALVAQIEPITEGSVLESMVIHSTPGAGVVPAPQAQIEEKAAFTVRAAPAAGMALGKLMRVSVGAINKDLIAVPNSDLIDNTQTNVAALVALLTNDGTAVVVTDTNGQPIESIEGAFQDFGKKRKRRRKKIWSAPV